MDMSSNPIGAFNPRTDFFSRVLEVFHRCHLETVLVGNAASMIHGAPVATQDADFLFRDAPVNRKKLKKVAAELGLGLVQPFMPASEVFRLVGGPVEIDLLPSLPGYRFKSVRAKAEEIDIGTHKIKAAPLALIIELKTKANRPKDRAALPVLRNTLKVLNAMRTGKPRK